MGEREGFPLNGDRLRARSIQPERFRVNQGRETFKRAASLAADDNETEELDLDDLRRQQEAIRSFTESVEMDFPPPPELPSALDIDSYEESYAGRMKESSTIDTIIEVGKLQNEKEDEIDPTLGETQKYVMAVPGPEQVDQELELHKSLINDEELELSDNEPKIDQEVRRKRPDKVESSNSEEAEIRKRYCQAALQRPRATTPTSWNVIDAYVKEQEEVTDTHKRKSVKDKMPPDAGAKIRVSIPNTKTGTRQRRSSMSWSDFYESMEKPMSRSNSRQESEDIDFDQEWSKKSTEVPESWSNQKNMSTEQEPSAEPLEEKESEVERRDSHVSQKSVAKEEPVQSQPEESTVTNTEIEESKQNEEAERTSEEVRAVPVRAAPPPPPGKKKPVEDAQVVPEQQEYQTSYDTNPYGSAYGQDTYTGYDQSGYGANSYYGQGYDYSAYNTTEYDQSSYNYDANAYGNYDQTAYDPNSQAAYDPNAQYAAYGIDGTAYDQNQYYGYGQDTQQYDPNSYGSYDSNTYNAGYDQSGTQSYAVGSEQATTEHAAGYNAGYDQGSASEPVGAEQATTDIAKALNSGYDQGGLSTSVVGADDDATTDDDAVSANGVEATLDTQQYPSTANYDYNAYGTTDCQPTSADVTVTDTTQREGQQSAEYNYSQYGTYDQYGTTNQEAYNATTEEQYNNGDYSAYGSTTYDYSAYGTTAEPEWTQPSESAPAAPTFSEPLFKEAKKEHDPFSWDVLEATGNLPPPRPPPARTPEPDFEESKSFASAESKPPPPRPGPPPAGKQPPRPPPPPASPKVEEKPAMPPPPRPGAPSPAKHEEPKQEEEEDPWARFKQMTDAVGNAVKSTADQLKTLSETTAAKEIKDESYIGQIGGTQQFELTTAQKQILKMEEEKKKAKADKKATKAVAKKKRDKVGFDPKKEEDMEKKAAELVARMAATRADLKDYQLPTGSSSPSVKDEQPEEENEEEEAEEQEEIPEEVAEPTVEEPEPKPEPPKEEDAPLPDSWAAFSTTDTNFSTLPTSESDFFSQTTTTKTDDAFGDTTASTADPFAQQTAFSSNIFETDPFDTRPIEEIIEEAKQNADLNVDVAGVVDGHLSTASTPTEGASPIPDKPFAFEDDFKVEIPTSTSTPLYDEDDTVPLEDFMPKYAGEGWEMMVRHPLKKKNFMSERCWKPCFVRIDDNMLKIFNSKEDRTPLLEILLQASYSLSDSTLQAYDAYGKIHTVKLQHVLYKERVGIRAGQISRLVEGHITKYGLPLEHAAQVNVLAKFAALDHSVLETFINTVEDLLFHCPAKRETTPNYKQDEVQIHCHDEYTAHVDKLGNVSNQRARVRMFCLSFLTGSPFLEIGLNDRRREGKEIVRRKDILPMYTEKWIRFEGLEFHNSVDQPTWEEEQVVKVTPPDSCFFEILRFRIRPPKNREKPLSVKSIMKIAGSKIEIKIDVMAAAQQQRAKGTVESTRTIPCEDIQIRFPIPEAWIYIFREERTWGVGSVHSKTRRTGKMKNIKDRLMGSVAQTEQTLIEVASGEAKYEHVYRSLVWRIPRLPEKHHQAYKQHLLKCRFNLSSYDLMPEEFRPTCDVEFTMPLATVSNTVVRSVSVEQHEDSDRVEKFVRYVAKCHYDLDIDYVQCNTLDDDTDAPIGYEVKQHQPLFDQDEIKNQHEGYGVKYTDEQLAKMKQEEDERQAMAASAEVTTTEPTSTFNPFGQQDDFAAYAMQGVSSNGSGLQRTASSSDEDDDTGKFPAIKINMEGYGYN